MNANRFFFLLRHDFTVIRRVKWRLAEIIYFPATTVLIWGFFAASYRDAAAAAALAVLSVNMLWNFASVAQSTTNMQILEDIWSGSIRQILLAGTTPLEYVSARIAFAMILSVPVGAMLLALSIPFGFTVHGMYAPAVVAAIATAVASVGLALLVAAAMFFLGREYGFLAWTIIQVFVLLSAPFMEPTQFPPVLREISMAMPFTDAFTIARRLAAGLRPENAALVRALGISLAYVAATLPLYLWSFRRAKKSGMLAKL